MYTCWKWEPTLLLRQLVMVNIPKAGLLREKSGTKFQNQPCSRIQPVLELQEKICNRKQIYEGYKRELGRRLQNGTLFCFLL